MKFGFLCYPGFEELDLIGPWEMATMWQHYNGGPECLTVGVDLAPVTCAKGLVVAPAHDFTSVGALDYLLVPGGVAAFEVMKDAHVVEYIRGVAANAKATLSVCTGSFLLQAAGLLKERSAATHWLAIERLRALGVDVQERRFVESDGVWSSSGVSAGIDMMLAFIAQQAGDEVAANVQLQAEYFPNGHLYGAPGEHPKAPAYIRELKRSSYGAQSGSGD
ncbi:MAG: DJ-1/PfpI family protein [Gammaproteobacteria bacterium]|nr:DJ-1/PfpI family protein [Gammaproteobacteria bacterium]